MAYTLPTWANSPATTSPISAANLGLFNTAINDLDTRAADRGINVKTDFGAVGNGTADDTTALQNALNSSFSTGRPVYLPKGTYKITATLNVTGRIAVIGSGWDSTVALATGVNDYAFTFDGVLDNRGYMTRFGIDGNCANQTAGGGIDAPGAAECTFDRLHLTNCYDYGIRLAGFNSSAFGHHNRVRDCQLDLTVASAGVGGGILLTSSDENYIINNTLAYLGGATTSRMIYDTAGLQLIAHNTFIGAQGGAADTRGVHLESGNRTSVIGNTFDGVGGDNVFVKGTGHSIIGNRFTFIGDQGTVASSGVTLEFGAVSCVVANNQLEASTSASKTRSYIRESIGNPGNNIISGNVLLDSAVLTVGKTEFNTTAAIPSRRALNFGVSDSVPAVALTDAATIATDAGMGNHFRVTLAGNRTLGAPTNPADGQRATWQFTQDGTGTRTVTLNAVFRLGTDVSSVTLSTAAGKTDYMDAVYNLAATKWDVVRFVRGY